MQKTYKHIKTERTKLETTELFDMLSLCRMLLCVFFAGLHCFRSLQVVPGPIGFSMFLIFVLDFSMFSTLGQKIRHFGGQIRILHEKLYIFPIENVWRPSKA